MTQGCRNLQGDSEFTQTQQTTPDLNFKVSLRRQKKNPGSFTASHKKGRIYAGVNLRLPGLEQAVYHLKTDWAVGRARLSPNQTSSPLYHHLLQTTDTCKCVNNHTYSAAGRTKQRVEVVEDCCQRYGAWSVQGQHSSVPPSPDRSI